MRRYHERKQAGLEMLTGRDANAIDGNRKSPGHIGQASEFFIGFQEGEF